VAAARSRSRTESPRDGEAAPAGPAHRTYVLDTSVLLSDPHALLRFDEHEVVIPVVVVTELEAKRTHPELGYFARSALRLLDDLRVSHGRLDEPLSVGAAGGTVRVELNHSDTSVLPSGLQLGDNDTRILAVARNLAAEGHDVVVVSKDLPMRVKASSVGLAAEEYRAELVVESGWTGMTEVDVSADLLDALYDETLIDLDAARDLPCHTGLVLMSDRGSALGRAPARVRWPCAQASRPSWSAGSTAGSSSSGRSTLSAARIWATSRARRTRRCRPGPRPSSTPSVP
jgi:PhoH-like ATPase